MAFSANALHNVHRYAATAQDILDAQVNGTVNVGQIVALSGTNRLFYGISTTFYKEFASPTDTISTQDSPSVDLTYTNGAITADVKVSANAGNIVSIETDGIYVAETVIPDDYVQSVQNTASINLNVDVDGKLTATSRLSATAGNYATLESDGIYVPTPVVPLDYIRSIEDTSNVDLTVDGSGKLTAFAKLSTTSNFLAQLSDGIGVMYAPSSSSLSLYTQSGGLKGDVIVKPGTDNAIVSAATGLFAQKITVDPASIGLLSITAGAIKLEKQASIEVHVVPNVASLADFVANNMSSYDLSTGDVVYLSDATLKTERTSIVSVANPTTVGHFVPTEFPDYTEAQIRQMISAGQGLIYNSSTGALAAKLSTDASNDLVFGTDNGLFMDAAAASVGIVKGGSTVNQTIEATLNEIYARWYDANNGLNMNSLTVKLGGALLEDTTIDGAFDLTIHNTKFDGTNIDVLTGDIKMNASTQGLLMKDSNGQYWKMTVNTAGQWLGTPFS